MVGVFLQTLRTLSIVWCSEDIRGVIHGGCGFTNITNIVNHVMYV